MGFEYPALFDIKKAKKHSSTGNWTRVSRVRAVYPSRLDYKGFVDAYPATIFKYSTTRITAQRLAATSPSTILANRYTRNLVWQIT